jgi:hypothetical protein
MMGSSLVDTLLKARLVRSSGFSWRVVSLSYALQCERWAQDRKE